MCVWQNLPITHLVQCPTCSNHRAHLAKRKFNTHSWPPQPNTNRTTFVNIMHHIGSNKQRVTMPATQKHIIMPACDSHAQILYTNNTKSMQPQEHTCNHTLRKFTNHQQHKTTNNQHIFLHKHIHTAYTVFTCYRVMATCNENMTNGNQNSRMFLACLCLSNC